MSALKSTSYSRLTEAKERTRSRELINKSRKRSVADLKESGAGRATRAAADNKSTGVGKMEAAPSGGDAEVR